MIKYILKMSDTSSVTWSAHLTIIFLKYNLPDPLTLLASPPWSKEKWKQYTGTVVTCYHEKALRHKSSKNVKLKYFNVQAVSLIGKPHPIISWLATTRDVEIARPHIKMLAGDYPCFSNLGHDRGIDPYCRLCSGLSHQQPAEEDLLHILTRCRATAETRSRLLPALLNLLAQYHPDHGLLSEPAHSTLTQFILDCTSLSLPSSHRISPKHTLYRDIARQCSDIVYAIHTDRTQQLKNIGLLRK